MSRRVVASFSGGETSQYMTYKALTTMREHWDEVLVVFANSSEENEETLIFVDRCDRQIFSLLGCPVHWVEAVVDPEKGKGTRHREVTFATAARNGEVFEEVIKKYGIPNMQFPHCTRELKLAPILSFVDAYGWERGSYDMAVGIRNDEVDRIAEDAAKKNIIYPLISMLPTTKPTINTWAERQAFRLRLQSWKGNCKTCWKKTDRKLFTIARENPEHFEFNARMEAKYAHAGAGEGPRTFFRKKRSTQDIMRQAWEKDFDPPKDDSQIFDADLDVSGGCGESCEVFADVEMF